MKKINLLLVFVLCLTIFSACKKEEENEPTPKENLVNKTWIVTSSETEIELPFGQTLPDSIQNGFDPTQGIEGEAIIFNEDGTFVVGEADNQQQGTWTLSEDGQTLTFSGLVEGDLTDFIDAQTLDNLQTFEVTTLTDTQLVIQNSTDVVIPAEIAEQLIGFAIPITVTVKLNITFDKQ
ncbi:MAG: hypothetical protein COZ18_07725 [Flexibacter sp. CG_4_10_14_3_um_filter_32_15]|nr:MAG: hypothetical protein COZ18_07725 [Flexibacter sp. CG_4_10_14_3_um_filter_32_15]